MLYLQPEEFQQWNRFSGYGCWCFQSLDNEFWKGQGLPKDEIDKYVLNAHAKRTTIYRTAVDRMRSTAGTHQFDLFCTSAHRLYFDLNLTSTFLAKLYFHQNGIPGLTNGRSIQVEGDMA